MISAIIPTYNRESVLIETIEYLLGLRSPPDEIVVVDQTAAHEPETLRALARLCADSRLRRVRLSAPSIPEAMNRGLIEAKGDIALFLDDDIVPDHVLVASHRRAHEARENLLVAGRVIQPWQEGVDFTGDREFHFASPRPREIESFMGGNFSLSRRAALMLGGFDENFVKVAYGFEVEFAFRWRRAGGVIVYAPDATIHHLRAQNGGTRAYGEHLTTLAPGHSVGAYYCALRTRRGIDRVAAFASRPIGSVATTFHLRRPWRIPLTLIAELRGMAWAVRLAADGPRLIDAARMRDADNV